jgi:hypothetical protein
MTDELSTQAEQPKKNNTFLNIISGVGLAAQWILQNSDFTLVNSAHPTL